MPCLGSDFSNSFDSWQNSRSLPCKLPKWCEGINTQSHYIARFYGKTCVGLRLSNFPVILCLSFVSDSPWGRHVYFGYWCHLGRIILILKFWLGICPQSQKMGDSSAAAVAFHLCRSYCINAWRSPSENINVRFSLNISQLWGGRQLKSCYLDHNGWAQHMWALKVTVQTS